MANFQGYYINLDNAREREKTLRKELAKKGMLAKYKRFNAAKGDTEVAKQKGLRPGEDGLWKSWINLLEMIESESEQSCDYIHIIEDDVVVSDQLYELINKLSKIDLGADILMTDMYTNISIYRTFEKLATSNLSEKSKYKLHTTSEYTGCAASCILHRKNVTRIKNLLNKEYGQEKLIPLDNYFRRMTKKGKLKILTTIPFLTTVQLSSISESTIQERTSNEAAITRTQIYNTHLRRMLSIFRKSTNIQELIMCAEAFVDSRPDKVDLLNRKLVEAINGLLEEEKCLIYRQDTRLKYEK